uniref:Uncharacterized protein n=1 Tax=Plectus sambesii TaxID=2011161 RepID=A0A914XGE5_9BILA
SGNVISISEKKGVLDCKRGQVTFTNCNDSLKTPDLRTRYAEGDEVVFFLEANTELPNLLAHTVCPERELQEGYGTISRVDVKCANGRCDDGQLMFFSSGRLSKMFQSPADQDLRRVLRVGDRFYYRAMRQHDTACLKATDILLSSHPAYRRPNFRRQQSSFGSVGQNQTDLTDDRVDEDDHRTSLTDARYRINERRNERHISVNRNTDSNEHDHPRQFRSLKSKEDQMDEQMSNANNDEHNRRSKRRWDDSNEMQSPKRPRDVNENETNSTDMQPNIHLLRQIEQYIRSHDELNEQRQSAAHFQQAETTSDCSFALQQRPTTVSTGSQTDLLVVKAWQKLGAMIVSDKALRKLLADVRPDILAAAVAAVNLGLAELRSRKNAAVESVAH